MQFKEWVLEEGEFWDAIKHGVSTGFKAFSQKRQEQAKKSETKTLTAKILSAEGKELEGLIKQIVDNGYTIRNGAVQKPPKVVNIKDWLLECTNTRTGSRYASWMARTYGNSSPSSKRVGGAHTARSF